MTPAVIDQVRRNLSELDLSAENAEIIEITRKLAENEDAKQRGQAELQEAVESARDAREVDGNAVAEALIAGAVLEAMTVAKWQEKADQLRAGLRSLSQQYDGLYSAKKAVANRAAGKVKEALVPLYLAQREAAQAAFDSLVSIRAGLDALGYVGLSDADLETDLRRIVVLDTWGSLTRPRVQEPTPEWLAGLEPELAKLGASFPRSSLPSTVKF